MKMQILKAIIQDEPIKAAELTKRFAIEDKGDRRNRTVRMIVAELVQEGWPIVGTNNGYLLAKSLREKRKWIARFRKQIVSMEQRIKDLNRAYYAFKSNEHIYRRLIKKPKRIIKRRSEKLAVLKK